MEYTVPGTYVITIPSIITSVSIVCVGGGGGAMAGITNLGFSGSSGGGGGALAYSNSVAVTPGQTMTITVGAGGAPVDSASPYTGNPGADSFVTYNAAVILRAGGGGAGIASSTISNPGGAGGLPSGTLLSGGGAGGAGGHRALRRRRLKNFDRKRCDQCPVRSSECCRLAASARSART